MIVKLRRKNARYPDLSPGLSYVVIGIEADDYRTLNDQGRPYLYPSRLFKITDPSKPHDWVTERGEEGDSYAYPQPLNAAGFFELGHGTRRGGGLVRLSAAAERRWIFRGLF